MFFAMLVATGACIFMSLRNLFLPDKVKGKLVSFENFLYLGMIYMTMLIGFGMIYFIYGMNGSPVLAEMGDANAGFINEAETSIYFSAMTLFSVGHGDVVPIGIGRWIAIIEALIGYTVPAAFVAKAVLDREN